MILQTEKERRKENGIQITKEHRDEFPADTSVRHRLYGSLCPRGGLLGGVRLPLRRGTAAEDIRPRRGQEPDAPRSRRTCRRTVRAEAREHVRRFHELFFTLSPEKSAIEHNVKRALLLADKSAYNYYATSPKRASTTESSPGNINQVLQVDSVVCNFDRYPYEARTYAPSDDYPREQRDGTHARDHLPPAQRKPLGRQSERITIEGFTVLENKDIRTIER